MYRRSQNLQHGPRKHFSGKPTATQRTEILFTHDAYVAAYLPVLFRRSNEVTSTRTFKMSCPIWMKFDTKKLQAFPLSNCESAALKSQFN
jgi:hypothetical protein